MHPYYMSASSIYYVCYRCTGNESNIKECPHEGLDEAVYCNDHKDDEGVFCYTSGKFT